MQQSVYIALIGIQFEDIKNELNIFLWHFQRKISWVHEVGAAMVAQSVDHQTFDLRVEGSNPFQGK